MLEARRFRDAIPAHPPPGEGNQQRTPIVLSRLQVSGAFSAGWLGLGPTNSEVERIFPPAPLGHCPYLHILGLRPY
jgi:hypothetical protein